MKKVGLLYDSISNNTGDIAMGFALKQLLAHRHDYDVQIVNPLSFNPADYDKIIVGGGQLIRPQGDDFYDAFRLPGSHILSAVGLLPPAEHLEYLNEYAFVSARTEAEAAAIRHFTNRIVSVMPCVTTLLTSDTYTIPGLDPGEIVVGVHIVPYTLQLCPEIIDIINAIPHKKVFIPFTHYNLDKSFMSSLPLDFSNAIMLDELTPLELHSVIGQMSYVIVSSLHASIFAYSQNVPFITLGQEKVESYFADRGLSEYVFSNAQDIKKGITKITKRRPDYTSHIQSDRRKVKAAIKKFEAAIDSASTNTSTKSVAYKNPNDANRLRLELAEQVILGRDRLLQEAIAKNRFYAKYSKELSMALKQSEDQREILQNSRAYKIGRLVLAPARFAVRLLKRT